MSPSMLRIAVVGHTNTGKTSLVRTLSHNREFGQVEDRAGTTRQVTVTSIGIEDETLIELYDSPGLENAPALIEWLERQASGRHDGPDRVARLLEDPAAVQRFDHEARVLELMLAVDIGLYVVDAREPVLEKYQDELAVLALCARPLVTVLNFTADRNSRERDWRAALARLGLHTVLAYDAVVRDPATERSLFEKLASLLDEHRPLLMRWLQARDREEGERRGAALEAIADMLLDVAAAQREYHLDRAGAREMARDELADAVRKREQVCVDTLLDLYRFGREDYADSELSLEDGAWAVDPLDPEAMRHYGIRTGRHAGAGASVGAVIDIGTGGLSLGAGTLIGTLAGAGTGLARSAGGRLIDRMRGRDRVAVDDAALRLLAGRQLKLLEELIQRGHASRHPLKLANRERWQSGRLPGVLRRARFHPGWSSLNPETAASGDRQTTLTRLVRDLSEESATESRR
jgi:hypothetical protein